MAASLPLVDEEERPRGTGPLAIAMRNVVQGSARRDVDPDLAALRDAERLHGWLEAVVALF